MLEIKVGSLSLLHALEDGPRRRKDLCPECPVTFSNHAQSGMSISKLDMIW